MRKYDVKVGEINEEELFSKGPKLSKKEREILREEVMKNNNLYGKNKPIETAFTANNFYIYNNFGDGDFSVIRRIKIEGNEDLINYLSNIVQNETYTNTRSITAIIREFRSRQKQYNSSNGNVKGERGYNATNGDLDLRQSSERGADNAEGNRNERQTTLGRGSVKTNLDGTNGPRYVPIDEGTILFSKGRPAGYVNLSSEMFKGRRPILSVLEAKDTAILNASKKWFESVLGEGNLVTDNHVSRDVYMKALQDGRSMRVLYSGKTDGEYDIVGFELDGVHYLDFNNMTSEMMMYELGSVWVNRLKANTELWRCARIKHRRYNRKRGFCGTCGFFDGLRDR